MIRRDHAGRTSAPANDLHAQLRIRQSRRARRMALNLRPPETIELVVPRGTSPSAVEAFLETHRAWIERSQREIRHQYRADTSELPATIELPAIGTRWRLSYTCPDARRAKLHIDESTASLVIEGPTEQTRRLLRDWLRGQGRAHLVPWLRRESRAIGLLPGSVQIRLQRTRWGSCSSRGCVSLNAGLLFLTEPIVRYLMVHELCHLRYMNHSRRFWELVARHLPNYRDLDARLADAWAHIPVWALSQ